MDTLLTLIIALGGITTGIGAIWAAVVARRQAQVTERSLTEQIERARLTLEYDLLTRLFARQSSVRALHHKRSNWQSNSSALSYREAIRRSWSTSDGPASMA
jgi:hypothetical protein